MSFREMSAWLMAIILLLAGANYFEGVYRLSIALGDVAPPNAGLVVAYIVGLTINAIIWHAILGAIMPEEANARADERDRLIAVRSGSLFGLVLAIGVVTSLGLFLAGKGANLMFHGVLGSLMVAQIAEYAHQIYLYRRGLG